MPDGLSVRGVAFLSLVLGAASAHAALSVADSVVRYDAGGDTYTTASAALGLPNADTGFGLLTPFNAAWQDSDLVGISAGGSLELHLSQPLSTRGRTLGVHAGVGLADMNWPNGTAGGLYTSPRQATVGVSGDGTNWVSLGVVSFDTPTNYYSQGVTTPGYQAAAGPGAVVADFSKPFDGAEDDFTGQNWSGILDLLDGSAGGTWLDLSGTGLSQVNYVKFDVADGQRMLVDSVVGVAVPEPAAGLVLLTVAGLALVRRRGI